VEEDEFEGKINKNPNQRNSRKTPNG